MYITCSYSKTVQYILDMERQRVLNPQGDNENQIYVGYFKTDPSYSYVQCKPYIGVIMVQATPLEFLM